MTNYLLQFGSYQLPATFRPAGMDGPIDVAEQERPRASGSLEQTGRKKSRSLDVRGELTADTGPDLLTLHDALIAGTRNAGIQNLYFGRDDRYYVAQCEGVTWSTIEDGHTYGVVHLYTVQFRACEPDAYAAAGLAGAVSIAASSQSITNTGNAESQPIYTITINGAGTGSIVIGNTTTGESMTLAGTFAHSDVIAIDRNTYAVTLNGVATPGLLSGRIPRLLAGANTITTVATTVTLTSATINYIPRFAS